MTRVRALIWQSVTAGWPDIAGEQGKYKRRREKSPVLFCINLLFREILRTIRQGRGGQEMLYRKWKGRLLLFLAGLFAALLFISQAAAAGRIEEKVLRLHVIANSDSEADQKLKLKVRDQVLAALQPLLEKTEDLGSSEAIVREHLSEIEALAGAVVREEKTGEKVTAELINTRFPEKTYGDCTFPAGNYDALRICIGEAKGKNWWCVLFPSLCFVDTVHGIVPEESRQLLQKVLTEEEYESLFTPGKSEYKIRWKAAEIWQAIFERR